MVFVSEPDRNRIRRIMDRLNGLNVLIVSDVEDFLAFGVTIVLSSTGRRLRPIINPEAVKKGKLSLNSKLMQISEMWEG